MKHLALPGRVLFLSADPAQITAQLAGAELSLGAAGPLRDDVSTDEISPITVMTHYDERLGRYPYVGLKAGDARPIGTDAVRHGGFCVTVAGKRYGKGSSREHSPVAEREAGIRLVIAESFERIYRQNADNVGLFTSTDFALVERIRRGEPVTVDELVAPRDALAAAILRAGGLLAYGKSRMSFPSARESGAGAAPAVPGEHRWVPASAGTTDDAASAGTTDDAGSAGTTGGADAAPATGTPLTLTEKILARHVVRTPDYDGALVPGTGGFVRADWRFIHEYYTGMCAHLLHQAFGRPAPLVETETIVAFEDHLSYSHRSPAHVGGNLLSGVRGLSDAHRAFVDLYGLRAHGYLPGEAGSEGISHPMMTELYALPGQLVAGTDSHTPHSGAVGCLAFGVGTTDMANAMVTGAVRFTVPESLRIALNGAVPAGVTAKDIVLHLLAQPAIRAGAGVGKVFEFCGPAIAALTTDERATLTNMTAELGGFTGIVAPDAETVRFLKERRGVDFVIEPWMRSDPGARYAGTVEIDCSALSPMVAAPGDPGNGVPLGDLRERAKVDIAYGGSCTAGKRDDFDQYHAVLSWAVEHGMRVPPGVKLYLQFGTRAVRDYCVERGYLAAFEAVGAELLQPGCGACANCGPGSSTSPGDVTVSAINRNFPGRSGPGKVWLASPPTVAASALAGELVSFAELRARVGGRRPQ